jgi:hypothetical protein
MARLRARSGLARAILASSLLATPAAAFDFFDGRVDVHGFYEAQVRSIVRDYDFSDDWDLTQWYNVLDVELEADLAPEGWGRFEIISIFSRVEVRYDCVWTQACTLFNSANVYGHRSEDLDRLLDPATPSDHRAGRLPKRLVDGRRSGFNGTMFTGNTRHYYNPRIGLGEEPPAELSRKALRSFQNPAYVQQFWIPGIDGVLGNEDDPAPFYMSRFDDCTYGVQKTAGPTNGVGERILLLGVDGCHVDPIGSLRDEPNLFRGVGSPNPPGTTALTLDGRVVAVPEGDFIPVLFGPDLDPNDPDDVAQALGSKALPFRPAPVHAWSDARAPIDQARGIYYPNEGLARLLRKDALSDVENFSETELAFNHGASQQQTKELKELYLDLEAFEGRLWIRAGRQNIVWGKTELFRTTDQFNPQDLALASLPGLEESRIPLWSLRTTWSFYDIGPLEDVRLELAANYDEFTPADLGRGGEPYTLDPVSAGWFGFEVHGVLGLGLAGARLPPDAWESWQGIESGARLEWRWDRFSFALSDFYGYSDTPYVEHVFRYSRNVDPVTGRPRQAMLTGECLTGAEEACLVGGTVGDGNALEHHSANQQLFAWICALTIGATDLDRSACGNTIFNSKNPLPGFPLSTSIAELQTNLLVGNTFANTVISGAQLAAIPLPHVLLSQDPCDGFLSDCVTPGPPGSPDLGGLSPTLNSLLTAQQQALLGCGEFYGTNCEFDGTDLLNSEASAILQSWPGFEGTFRDWDTTDPNVAQPGTVGFAGGPVCTRFEDGQTFILPGCRGPAAPGYDPNVDGSPVGLVQPFFDPTSPDYRGVPSPFPQQFQNEVAALSFNYLMFLAAFSRNPALGTDPDVTSREFDLRHPTVTRSNGLDDDEDAEIDEADEGSPDHIGPFRTDGCSYRRTQLCYAVQSFLDFSGVQRNEVRAGGSARFGRRDFVWAMGAPLVARFEKRNVLGFSLDWAEDVTKSNWSVESTWIEGLPFFDNDEPTGLKTVDTYNLTISTDRPTFVNFINANRTFFINSQWFLQYVDGYEKGMPSTGPYNLLGTLTISTGYFQDRLLPAVSLVYDVQSNSGAVLPSIEYRFTGNFSVTFGLAAFYGRPQFSVTGLTQLGGVNRVGRHAHEDAVENGLSPLRDRDEIHLRVRYTF